MDDLDRLYHRLLDAVRESAPQLRERRFRLGDIPQHLLPYRLHRRDLGFDSVQQYEGALARLAAGERGYLSADATVQQAFRRAVDGGDVPLEQALRLHGDALVALTPEARHTPSAPSPAVPAAGEVTPAPTTGNAAGNGGLVIPIVRLETPSDAPPAAPAPRAPPPVEHAAVAGSPPADRPTAGAPRTDPPTEGGPTGPTGGLAGALTGVFTDVLTSALTGSSPAPPAAPVAASPPAPSAPASSAPASSAPPPPAAMPFPVRPPTPVVGGTCRHCGRPLPADRGVTFCPYCGENLTIRRCPACSTELEAGWRFCITCGREVDELAANAPNANAPNVGAPNGEAPGGGLPDSGTPAGS